MKPEVEVTVTVHRVVRGTNFVADSDCHLLSRADNWSKLNDVAIRNLFESVSTLHLSPFYATIFCGF